MRMECKQYACANCHDENYLPDSGIIETEFMCNNCGFRNFVDWEAGEVTGCAGPDMAYMWCAAWSAAYELGQQAARREIIGKWNNMSRLVRAAAGLSKWAWWHWVGK